MIISRLIGGLGNQMFQYAAGLALAEKRRCRLVLDSSGFKTYWRPLALQVYKLDPQSQISDAEIYRSGARVFSWSPPFFHKISPYKEPHFHLDPGFFEAPRFSYLDGYWQSHKYFDFARQKILDSFTVTAPLSEKTRQRIEEIDALEARGIACVAVHVRRGDYVSNPNANAVHGTCEMDYYWSGLKILEEHSSAKEFRVYLFSDDIAWVSEEFRRRGIAAIPVDHNDSEHGYEDIEIMRHCSHFVIANSSFSWWGAWLSQARSKWVVAPKNWFRDAQMNSADLIPLDWIRI
jgi:hypothetical protein